MLIAFPVKSQYSHLGGKQVRIRKTNMMEPSYQSTLSEKKAVELKKASVQCGPRAYGWLLSDPRSFGDWGMEPFSKLKQHQATAGQGDGGRVTHKLQLKCCARLLVKISLKPFPSLWGWLPATRFYFTTASGSILHG